MIEEQAQQLRILEAVLFAAEEPLGEDTITKHLTAGTDVAALLGELTSAYEGHGVNLVRVAGKWTFRTAEDLAVHLQVERETKRRLSRAAIETLSIVSYHQPVTRAEIENIRGVSISRGTLDALMEAGWVKPGRRRDVPGRPTTWVTTESFLSHFGLNSLKDLPGTKDLKAAGLLDARPAIAVYGARAHDDVLPSAIPDEDSEISEPLLADES
ncbi:MAG: SMC-Scp complex subunit ScpB [Alphaproteobacteria bacterium]